MQNRTERINEKLSQLRFRIVVVLETSCRASLPVFGHQILTQQFTY